jgi:hypothetical protein
MQKQNSRPKRSGGRGFSHPHGDDDAEAHNHQSRHHHHHDGGEQHMHDEDDFTMAKRFEDAVLNDVALRRSTGTTGMGWSDGDGVCGVMEDQRTMSTSGVEDPMGWWRDDNSSSSSSASNNGGSMTVEATHFAHMMASAMDEIMAEDETRTKLRENIDMSKGFDEHALNGLVNEMKSRLEGTPLGDQLSSTVRKVEVLLNTLVCINNELTTSAETVLENEREFRAKAGARIDSLSKHAHLLSPGNETLATSIYQIRSTLVPKESV